MPYYCTVPRCTSMAGKAKNVSFHQFPRDEELARLWNRILKRGKPYTKYSKVCSLHFRPEDYTITSVGKNKGQWRTLRKDAIPSQNLPSESPGPTTHRSRSTGAWVPSLPPNVMDTRMQQQMAQAIYMQTMLAMQAATNGTSSAPISSSVSSSLANTSNPPISEIEKLLQTHTHKNGLDRLHENNDTEKQTVKPEGKTSYKCEECSKCFKDPDVYILHRRTHTKKEEILSVEKENLNSGNRQETLRANPILANLLKSGMSNEIQEQIPNSFNNVFEVNNILSIENQIMTALAANMENYIRNLSSMLIQAPKEENGFSDTSEDDNRNDFDENSDSNDHCNDENQNVDKSDIDECLVTNMRESNVNMSLEGNINEKGLEGYVKENGLEGSAEELKEPNCDKEDLNESKDSNSLVIDENV